MLKFSVIVPVYNVEKYLRTCVDSILCQNIPKEEYEVILINDGSIDNSGMICEEYKKCYPNIILLNQKNKGASLSRNRGLEIAKGKYIIFVDSDDHIQKNTFSAIFQEMEKGKLDALLINSDIYMNNGKLVSVLKPGKLKPGEVTDGADYILGHGFSVPVMVWHYVYRREFLRKEKLFFAAGLFHEDQEWIAHWFPLCKRIGYLDIIFYHYMLSDVSIMRSRNIKKCFDLFRIFELIQNDAEEYRKKGKAEVYHVLKRYAASMMWLSLRSCVAQGFRIKQLIVSEEIRKQILKYGYLDRRHRFFIFLIWIKAYWLTEILIRLVILVRGK